MSSALSAEITVGLKLLPLTLPPVDRTTIALFGLASGDVIPIHLDQDFARKAGMPDVFAQGMLGMAWMGRALTRWAFQTPLREFNVRFQGITYLGHVITVSERIAEIVERCARIELSNVNQFGEIKITCEALVALNRRGETAGEAGR